MIYILFLFLLVLFVVSYTLSGKDFFAPATIQILSFAGSVMMCIIFMWSMDAPYSFHWGTIAIVLVTMSMTTLIGIAVHNAFGKIRIQTHTPESVKISPISNTVTFFILGLVFFTIVWLLKEIRRIGGSGNSFFSMMHDFRALNSYSTEEEGKLPWILNQMLSMMRVLLLLYGFNLIRFFDVLTLRKKLINIFIIGLCVIGLLLTGIRTNVLTQLIACFVIFHLLRIQKEGKYKQYRFKSLARIVLVIIIIMIAFFGVKSFVGRTGNNNAMNLIGYLSYYTGSQYIALDQYLQNPLPQSSIFGKETFHNLIMFLIRYNLIDYPPYVIHLEFRPVGAGFYNNVYTFIRPYYQDFGMMAVFILHGASMLFLSIFYEYIKRKRGNVGILFFGQTYYTIVLSFFSEWFYSNVFSMTYLKMLFILIVLYQLLFRKRIRIKRR